MKRYHGAERGPKGAYLNTSTGEFVQITEEAPFLPGGSEAKYVRMPSVLAMITGPFAGLVFIIFLPFVGIAGVIGYLGYKLGQGIVSLERKTVHNVAVGWQPGRAYFTRRGRPDRKPAATDEKELSELEEEITKRRKSGER
ncbi:MAG: hypothetical protein ABID71_08360 [Chloroflexota bacterium]